MTSASGFAEIGSISCVPLSTLARGYMEALLARKRHRAVDLVMQALDDGLSMKELYLEVFQPVQYEIGRLWQYGQISVAHEHYCTNATQLLMANLYPRLFDKPKGNKRLLATCVAGELHELGLRMLADFFEMEGWDTDFLGANVPLDSVVLALEEKETTLLAIGTTMHYNLGEAAKLISAVRQSQHAGATHILLGGHAVRGLDVKTALGADGTAQDAASAIELAQQLTSSGKDSLARMAVHYEANRGRGIPGRAQPSEQ